MSRKVLFYNFLLLLAAVIWGGAMVAQSVGAGLIGPWSFVFLRFAISALVLVPVSLLVDRKKPAAARRASRKRTLRGGFWIGLFLGLASVAQQAGVRYTTAGKAGFITALYVVLVPLAALLLGRKPAKRIWFCAALGLLGLYFISIQEDFTLGLGDALVLLCAVLFVVEILFVDHYAPQAENPVRLAVYEFAFAALVALPGMILEQPRLSDIAAAWLPIAYAGVLSGAVGYTLQILGQRHTDPAIATLLMSLEAVFSALFGWLLLSQALSLRELLGCVLVFAAVVLAQIPLHRRKPKKEEN